MRAITRCTMSSTVSLETDAAACPADGGAMARPCSAESSVANASASEGICTPTAAGARSVGADVVGSGDDPAADAVEGGGAGDATGAGAGGPGCGDIGAASG